MSIFGDYPTFSACLISPCLCYFTIAVNPSANASVGSPGMGLPWLFQLCSPEELCRCCVGISIQVSLEMAVPSPHSLACPELLPARDSFSASLNPAAGSSWRQGVVAQLYLCLCLPSTLCQRNPALLPDLGRGSVCSCWEKLSPAIQHRGRAGMRMSWDLWI